MVGGNLERQSHAGLYEAVELTFVAFENAVGSNAVLLGGVKY
jgi:hypothetical protein